LSLAHPVLPVVVGAILIFLITKKKWGKVMITISKIIQNVGGTFVGSWLAIPPELDEIAR
jgi:hypothetical protein